MAGASLVLSACSAGSVDSHNFPFTIRKEYEVTTPGAAVAVTWSPDNSRLAAASGYGEWLSVWDASGRPVQRIQRRGNGPVLGGSISFARGSSELLFAPPAGADADTALSIWDIATGQVVGKVPRPDPGMGQPYRAQYFVVSPDQTRLAIGTSSSGPRDNYQQNVAIYDTRTWSLLNGYRLPDGVFSLAEFKGGSRFIAGLGRQGVAILDPSEPEPIQQYQVYPTSSFGTFAVNAVAGSPDGALVLGGVDVMNLEADSTAPGPAGWRKGLGTVWVIRSSDGARLATLSFPTEPIRHAAWDPKGRYVAFLDAGRGLYLWQPLANPLSYARVTIPSISLSIAISPDGRHIAVTTDRGITVYLIQ